MNSNAEARHAVSASRRMTIASAGLYRRQLRHFLIVNVGALVLAGGAITWAATHGPTVLDVVLLLAFGLLGVTGVEIGFHRGLAHGAFSSGPRIRALLAALGAMAGQGPAAYWVANHRRHHACSDRDGDPHSPRRGFWHAHMGWMLDREVTLTARFAPDLLADPVVRAVDRRYVLWVASGLLAPALIGGAATGTWAGLASGALWGGGLRLFLIQHLTFAVNSLCHRHGTRPFQTNDRSGNLALLALPTLGGAWHNNHHAFPTAADLALLEHQWDAGGALIRLFARLGWLRDVVIPQPAAVLSKLDAGVALHPRLRATSEGGALVTTHGSTD